ncbi:MAG: hypothetical protein ACYC1M_16440 [Armatimonadota bacterium]
MDDAGRAGDLLCAVTALGLLLNKTPPAVFGKLAEGNIEIWPLSVADEGIAMPAIKQIKATRITVK